MRVTIPRAPAVVRASADWWWAAVAVSINEFLDTAGAWTQATLASSVLQKGCSALPNPGDPCDCVFSLDGALKVTGNLREPKGAYFNQFLNFTDLATYWHSSSFPVCARIVWDDGSGHAHFIALTDCIQLIGGQRLVTV